METVSVTEARASFADLLEASARRPILIERRGEPAAVLISAAEFERLQEALDELDDVAAFDAAMAEEGENLPWEQAKIDLGWV
ncbi:MAG: type II toxin-antitoxin system Phd/YefM family antitoxin [Propionibacteriaceae bacterium]|nr:type II toxin-antitoxin system Phd/YefM family antitoxin [Propionibacteriaceae bacterium]